MSANLSSHLQRGLGMDSSDVKYSESSIKARQASPYSAFSCVTLLLSAVTFQINLLI